MRIRTIIAIGILVLGAGAVVWYQTASKNRPVKVETAMVEEKDIPEIVSASGKVEADRLIPVVSQVRDKVTGVLVKEGDEVEKDEAVLKLESFGEVKSPIAGRIVKIEARLDQTVAPGTSLVIIADLDPTYVSANVDETDISKIKTGQSVKISLDAYPNKEAFGKVEEIGLLATSTQAGGTAFPTKIKITSAKETVLRVGLTADVEIILTEHKDVLTIPIEAVVERDGKNIVFVVEDSTVEKREVQLGLSSEDVYEIKSGLKLGEMVVVKGANKLKGGERTE